MHMMIMLFIVLFQTHTACICGIPRQVEGEWKSMHAHPEYMHAHTHAHKHACAGMGRGKAALA